MGVDISSLFGLAVCAMLLLVWVSDDHVRQKLGLLLLFAWTGSNLTVNMMGFTHAPLVIPSLDAMVAVLVALIGYAHKSKLALAIFVIYAFVGTVHITALIMRAEMTYNYYAILNGAFALQLSILGASSAWHSLSRWTAWGGERLRPHPARW